MFYEQVFSRGNKGDVIIIRFQLISFENINFLQTYFINKHQYRSNTDLKISLDDINDILTRIDRVQENNDLASELLPTSDIECGNNKYNQLYFNELEEVKKGLSKIKDEWDEGNENYLFTSWLYNF